jgi:hypothetical protein
MDGSSRTVLSVRAERDTVSDDRQSDSGRYISMRALGIRSSYKGRTVDA